MPKSNGLRPHADYKIEKVLTTPEVEAHERRQEGESDRVKRAKTCATKHHLNMRFFSTQVGYDSRNISFFFTAPEPVDFRELLKAMALEFKGRIHLQRVSDRDRAEILDGIGICGRVDCCTRLKISNDKVPLNTVRDQGIMIKNNDKIFGVCGKLKRCYGYEINLYRDNRRYLPHIQQAVTVEGQKGRAVGLDILNKKVRILLLDKEFVETFPIEIVEYENKRIQPERVIKRAALEMELSGVGI
jgi:cell fate regulator YaaT (PSP1 superfamily)